MAMTDNQAADLLARVEAGSTIRSLTSQTGAMFSQYHYTRYCRKHPSFKAAILAASKANERKRKIASAERRTARKTHCNSGHAFGGDNDGYKFVNGYRTRYCRMCCRIAAQQIRPMTAEQVNRVTKLINDGVPLGRIAHGGPLHVTGHRNIAYQRTIDPAFDRLMAEANARQLAAANGPAKIALMHRRQSIIRVQRQADDYRTIRAMTPDHLPADVRDEIAQNVVVAMLEGSLRRADIRSRIRSFVTEHNRMFPVNFAKFGSARLVSLDEVLFDDGNRTRGDTVSQGLWG